MEVADYEREDDLNREPIQARHPTGDAAGLCPLSPEEVSAFREIMREETGVDMSETEAWNRAIELIALFRMLIGPMPEDPEG